MFFALSINLVARGHDDLPFALVFKSVRDRDDKINALLLSIVDMLGFMKEIEPLPKIRNLQDTVSAMMKQIYECALFIQAYGERSLIGMYTFFPRSSRSDVAMSKYVSYEMLCRL